MIKLSQPQIPESAIDRVSEILKSGQLVHGEECIAFERELADYLGVAHALVLSSGTAALHVALLCLNIGSGDAVIVPDFTFVATANVIEMTGAKTILVDVQEDSYNLDPELLEQRIIDWAGPEHLKAIMPVMEFGNPTNLTKYREIASKYDLMLIEDAACALGGYEHDKPVGTIGDFGCFSFHPRKILTTGEGGALVTNDYALYQRAKLFRNHGMVKKAGGVEFVSVGLNYRLTNFQASLGRELLPFLDKWIECRQEIVKSYIKLLSPIVCAGKITLPKIPIGHSVQTYMICLGREYDRDKIIIQLYEMGVETNLGAQSLSAIGLYQNFHNHSIMFPVGQNLYKNGLALPMHENLVEDDIKKIVDALTEILGL